MKQKLFKKCELSKIFAFMLHCQNTVPIMIDISYSTYNDRYIIVACVLHFHYFVSAITL